MFRKGMPKVAGSGRKKGSKNKKYLPEVQEFLYSRGINPLQEIIKVLRDKRTASEHKLQGWKTILSYCYRKPGLELPGDEGPLPTELTDTDDLTDDELLKLEAEASKSQTN